MNSHGWAATTTLLPVYTGVWLLLSHSLHFIVSLIREQTLAPFTALKGNFHENTSDVQMIVLTVLTLVVFLIFNLFVVREIKVQTWNISPSGAILDDDVAISLLCRAFLYI